MKKITVTFCILMLLSLGLIVNTGIVSAYQEGYEVNNYVAITEPTIDGQWTPEDEWNDTATTQLDGNLNVTFRNKYVADASFAWVNQYYLVEFFDDTTEDAEDYFRICYEAPPTYPGENIGGTTPQTDCLRIDFVGHDQSGLTVYKGDGSAWVEFTNYTWPEDIEIVDSISGSPSDSNPHLIVEIKIEHLHFELWVPQWIRIGVYDASNDAAGEQAWPDSSVDAPDEWGLSTATQTTIPEGLNFTVMVFLSSVSLLVGSQYLRKRLKRK
jgi:hypothetical protein